MGILSIMIDEAGNFDMDKKSNPFYCLTLVFHNQNDEIHQKIEMFDAQMEKVVDFLQTKLSIHHLLSVKNLRMGRWI